MKQVVIVILNAYFPICCLHFFQPIIGQNLLSIIHLSIGSSYFLLVFLFIGFSLEVS